MIGRHLPPFFPAKYHSRLARADMAANNPLFMRNRPFERQKRIAAWSLSTLAWLGAIGSWIAAMREGMLPWQGTQSPDLEVLDIILIMSGLAGFIASLPDDREDVNETSLWFFAVWCLMPFLLMAWLYFWPR